MKEIATYKNGNVYTTIYGDGTKIHFTYDDEMIYQYPECHDIMISQKCINNCPWCYYNCSPTGQHGNLKNWNFFDSMRPYTEIAINLQMPWHPDLYDFLKDMKERKIIVNVTINQNHFMTDEGKQLISDLVEKDYIKGIGISLTDPFQEGFLEEVKKYPNAVIHVINGIITPKDISWIMDRGLKLLFLGFKTGGRGRSYSDENIQKMYENYIWTLEHLQEILNGFDVVSFDNLALKQMHIRCYVTKEQWDMCYAGEDGTNTFALDLVHGTFSKSSTSKKTFPIGERSIDEMFDIIRKEG